MILPLFPLKLVAFPNETINLHIFEPRYKQLINKCWEEKIVFGLPPIIDNQISYTGTSMKIEKIVKKYPNGEMDIVVKGIDRFDILDFIKPDSETLFLRAETDFIAYQQDSQYFNEDLYDLIKEFYEIIKEKFEINENAKQSLSFYFGHKLGLEITEEFELLQTINEKNRQIILLTHLQSVLPILKRIEKAKIRISMNGHFKANEEFNF
jgi:Lon protease-like protein